MSLIKFKSIRLLTFLTLTTVLIASFQNCSKQNFTIDTQKKTQVLNSESIFSNNLPAATSAPINDVENSTTEFPISKSTISLDNFNGTQCEVTLKASLIKPPFTKTIDIITNSASVNIEVTDLSQNVTICKITKKSLSTVPTHTISLSGCNLKDGYQYKLTGSAILENGDMYDLIATYQNDFSTAAKSAYYFTYTGGKIQSDKKLALMRIIQKCDADDINKITLADPLIIDLGDKNSVSKAINLTSIENGLFFDILGTRSSPTPHTKKKVGWIQNHRYAFLALPNKNGKVNGIDELFGDSTLGPDNDYSANGFAALKKYDDNFLSKNLLKQKDQIIDMQDSVFNKLRLWVDRNSDGIAQEKELLTLTEAGVEAIDLNYDPSYRETDQYGNVTAFKSIVKMTNGDYNLIFDLWFNLKN